MEKKLVKVKVKNYLDAVTSSIGDRGVVIKPAFCSIETKEEAYYIYFKRIIKFDEVFTCDICIEDCSNHPDLGIQYNRNKTIGIIVRRVPISVKSLKHLSLLTQDVIPNFINKINLLNNDLVIPKKK